MIAVNDAYRLFPFAPMLYSCDERWWDYHAGCRGFGGERWSSQGDKTRNDKRACAQRHGLNLIRGCDGDGFSLDPSLIHYGDNSGFQAVNMAGHALGWRGRVVLVGFDMRMIDGKRHFFGEHPEGLRRTTAGYKRWPKHFEAAAKVLPAGIEIVNCTPGSALTCFRSMSLADALR